MKLFLNCEFTHLNQRAKLISLALVSEACDEFYVELTDTYQVEDCSEFVIENVIPQLDLPVNGLSFINAQIALKTFLASLNGLLEVCSDAPEWDWDFFCQLASVDHSWPRHIVNKPTNLIQLFKHLEADDIGDVTLPELPHHALLDARLLSTLYRELRSPEPQIKERQ